MKRIPEDTEELIKVFRELCEKYADEEDEGDPNRAFNHKARNNLLAFCHAYAYKVNGIELW